MTEPQHAGGGGVGFTGLLTVLFVGLKLGHVIDWSWWWVLSPLWIGPLLALAIVVVVGAVYLVLQAFSRRTDRRARPRDDRGWGNW